MVGFFDVNAGLLAGRQQNTRESALSQDALFKLLTERRESQNDAVARDGARATTAGTLLSNRITGAEFDRDEAGLSAYGDLFSNNPQLQALATTRPDLLEKQQEYKQSEQMFPVKLQGEKLGNQYTGAQINNVNDTIRSRGYNDNLAGQQMQLRRQAEARAARAQEFTNQINQLKLNDAQKGQLFQTTEIIGNVAEKIASSPPEEQPRLYDQARVLAGRSGITLPREYDPANLAKAIEQRDMVRAMQGPQSADLMAIDPKKGYLDKNTGQMVIEPQDGQEEYKPTQYQAATYATRAEDAATELYDGRRPSGKDRAVYNSWVPGDKYMVSKEDQIDFQAEKNLVNAILRRESGAAIGKDEFDNAKEQYIPLPGDSPEVVQRKKDNAMRIISGLKAEAGGAYGQVGGQQSAGGNIQDGQTATNPKTGQKLVYRGGSWQEAQ